MQRSFKNRQCNVNNEFHNLEQKHEQDEKKIERQQLRAQVKKKATNDLTSWPSKIIGNELHKFADQFMGLGDVHSITQSLYHDRRTVYPILPKSWGGVLILIFLINHVSRLPVKVITQLKHTSDGKVLHICKKKSHNWYIDSHICKTAPLLLFP